MFLRSNDGAACIDRLLEASPHRLCTASISLCCLEIDFPADKVLVSSLKASFCTWRQIIFSAVWISRSFLSVARIIGKSQVPIHDSKYP